MSELIKADNEYKEWIAGISNDFRKSQIRASMKINDEMLRFYWKLGKGISSMSEQFGYGMGFYKTVSDDLKSILPDVKSFSPTNLKYMRYFYEMYPDAVICPQVEDELIIDANRPQVGDDLQIIFRIPWGHNKIILDKCKGNSAKALFYIRKTIENNWSRDVLLNFLGTDLYERQGKAITNFSNTLPIEQSDLAQAITKDPYNFDFLTLRERYDEKELKDALIEKVNNFLMELGTGFAYMGREVRIEVGDTEKFIDMLFYNTQRHCYVVVEIKTGKFDSSYAGQLGTYVVAVNHQMKTEADNPTLGLLTRFWLAEAYYRTGKTDEALRLNDYLYQNSSFRKFAEYPLMLYSQGYNYFSKEEYEKAIDWFYLFLETHGEDMDLIIESKLRIGDAFFMLKDYSKAASVYEEVAMVDYQDESVVYAAYQCALCCGLLSDMNKKTAILETVMDRGTDAAVYPAAVYELGRTYVQTGHSDKAERCFKYLLNEVNDPVYNVKAMLELGMLYSNAGNYDTALSYLTRIVEETPLSEDTENALAVIESIYTTLNRPEEYFAYLDRVGMSATKTADEKEVMMFNASEQIYLSGDYPAAERSLRAFISRYPDGQKTPLAYFYLGETLSELGRKEAAASAYAEVMDKGEGSSVEISTLHYAEICYDLEQYDKAAAAYEALYAGARIENNRYEALVGMMKSYFMNEKYRMAIDAAAKVLASQAIMDDDRLYAQYVTAKSSLSLGRRTEALPLLRSLSGQPFTPQGAEAYYLLIQDTYDAGNFEEVENLVYAFSDSQTNQLYWLAKSFIVLGDSFAEREEWEQAEATFRSIKDGYEPQGPKDDVLDQVDMRIDRLNKITEQQ